MCAVMEGRGGKGWNNNINSKNNCNNHSHYSVCIWAWNHPFHQITACKAKFRYNYIYKRSSKVTVRNYKIISCFGFHTFCFYVATGSKYSADASFTSPPQGQRHMGLGAEDNDLWAKTRDSRRRRRRSTQGSLRGATPLQTLKNRPHLITRAPSQQSS